MEYATVEQLQIRRVYELRNLVHYNMFVRHGDDYTNEDPEADIWCQKCGETSMDDPEDEEEEDT